MEGPHLPYIDVSMIITIDYRCSKNCRFILGIEVVEYEYHTARHNFGLERRYILQVYYQVFTFLIRVYMIFCIVLSNDYWRVSYINCINWRQSKIRTSVHVLVCVLEILDFSLITICLPAHNTPLDMKQFRKCDMSIVCYKSNRTALVRFIVPYTNWNC